jgi:hypothetical protein|uniref:LamG-like jellyroll fold domain-containing protein n=1 Tax=viral metagenome TaxID=1070528 RepID=A0A6C0IQM3_9ZZZZ
MNTTVIVLGVVIILLIYVLYYFLSNRSSSLTASANLKQPQPPLTTIEKANNSRYGYTLWLYVNTWDNNVEKTIFSRDNNMKLYLDKTGPLLKMDMAMSDDTTETMLITDNFPLQKWVCIGLSVDNQFVDAYIDGKLMRSQRFFKTGTNTMPKVPPTSDTPILVGNMEGKFDAYLANFKRWIAPLDPKTVWENYLDGNGSNRLLNVLSSYGVDISILKNEQEQSRFSII